MNEYIMLCVIWNEMRKDADLLKKNVVQHKWKQQHTKPGGGIGIEDFIVLSHSYGG